MISPDGLVDGIALPHVLHLRVADVPIRVATNDRDVWAALGAYYAPWLTGAAPAVVEIRLAQGVLSVSGRFVDVVRRAGRVKEAVQDVPGGRLVLKRATGMVMGLAPGLGIAVGDLRANLNQAINLVNACYAKVVLARGHALLHASAVVREGRAVLLAGPPGAGKSTAALHLVEAGFNFLSNDRVLARPVGGRVEAVGYPKQPRVNPGTLLGHPRLGAMLKPDERERLRAMDAEALWRLEDKRDVDLAAVYGPGTVMLRADAAALVLLEWRRDDTGFAACRLAPREALDRLELFRKDLGAFDLDRDPLAAPAAPDADRYRQLLEALPVTAVRGAVRFDALVAVVTSLLAR